MISFDISFWELALIIVAIAFVFGTVHLIHVLKNLAELLKDTSKITEDNRTAIKNTMDNIQNLSKEATTATAHVNHIADEVDTAVNTVKTDVLEPLAKILTRLSSLNRVIKKRSKAKS